MRCNRLPPCLAFFLALTVALCGAGAAADAPDTPELRRMLAESAAALRLQTDFPSEPADGKDGYVVYGSQGAPPTASHNFATTALWIAVTVFVVVLLLTILDNLRQADPMKKRQRPAQGDANRLRQRSAETRLESDRLAADGDYAGAMHILLLRSVEEMRRRLGVPVAASLTSRELLRKAGLPVAARQAFADIVGRVEISWFGDHKPNAAEYAACRSSFTAFTNTLDDGDAE